MGFFNKPIKATKGFFGIGGGGGGSGVDQLAIQALLVRQAQEQQAQEAQRQALAIQRAKEEEGRQRGLANDEIVRNLTNRINQDQFNINKLGRPAYPIKGNTNLSSMSERSKQLRSDYSNKKAPYANKISRVLNKNSEGFSPAQSENLLSLLRRGNISENEATKRMEKQFGQNYGYEADRKGRLQGNIKKDTNRAIDISRNNLKSLNDQLGLLEDSRNVDVANAFRQAGSSKMSKRAAYLDQLERFGNQQNSFEDLKDRALRDAFEDEYSHPQRKINSLKKSLLGVTQSSSHPDRENMRNQELQRLQNIYNTPFQSYPGQRVVGIQPETQQSFDFINNFNPKYNDSNKAERKTIERDLLNNSLINKTYNKIPVSMEPMMRNLDLLSNQQLKQASKDIAGKHVRLGTYGSGAHKAETEKNMRNILKKVQQEREGILSGVSKAEMELGGAKDRTALTKHGLLDTLGNYEYVNRLDQNQYLNRLGWERREKLQKDENEALKNWYIQQQSNIGDVDSYDNMAKQYGIDLPTFYSSLQRNNNKPSVPAIMGPMSHYGQNPNSKAFAYALARRSPVR